MNQTLTGIAQKKEYYLHQNDQLKKDLEKQNSIYKKSVSDYANLKQNYEHLTKIEQEQEIARAKLMKTDIDKDSLIKKEKESEETLKNLLKNLQSEK